MKPASEQNASAGAGNPRGDLQKAEAAVQTAETLRHRQTSKDSAAAAALLEESARLFQSIHLNVRAADAYIQIGEIHFTRSEYKRALGAYRQALRVAGNDREIRCRSLSRMARTYASTGQSLQADTYSQQAVNLSEGLSQQAQAAAREARGEALFWLGENSKAEESFSKAGELFAEAKDDDGRALALLMQALARHRAGGWTASVGMGREALQLWHSHSNDYGAAQAYSMLASASIVAGDFAAAQCEYQEARRVFRRTGDKDNEAIVLNGMGYTQWRTGDLEASLENYQRAKEIFSALDDRLGTAEVITGMGRTLADLRHYERLLPLYREQLRLAQLARNPVLMASTIAELAGVHERERHYQQAETLYRRALTSWQSLKNPYRAGDILIHLARLFISQRKYSHAISFLEQALALKRQTQELEDIASIQYELAYIYLRLNRTEDARAAIEKTIDIIESQRLKIGKFDSRADYFGSVHKYYALYIQILMLLHQQFPDKGFLQQAVEASEKSKVRAFLDLLSVPTEGFDCGAVLTQQLAQGNSAVSGSENQQPSAAPVSALQDIQEEIGSDGTLLLEYSLGDEKSYVWVVDKDHIVAHELAPAEQIRRLVGAMRGAITARQQETDKSLDERNKRLDAADAAYYSYARQLSRLLLGALDLSGAKRLLIVPDASLQYISFAALPVSNKKSDTLVNHHEVVMLPSASALSTLRKAAVNRGAPTSLAAVFADPVFEHDDPRLSKTGQARKTQGKPQILKDVLRDAHQSQHLVRLEGSRKEAENIRKAFPGQDVLVAEDFRANRAFVLQGALEHYRFVHLATHGFIDPRRPEMSGLVLSLISEDGKNQDGYLRLGDIYKLKLSADLVVLSACQSALGKDVASEGIIGLPRAFLYAGAKSVIASLWKVDDEATAAFMKEFYARIQRGESPSSALRGAQIEMARSAKWAAPFYWAAFVLQGDYK